MNFKVEEIKGLTFRKSLLGGYKKKDVQDFLRKVARDYQLYNEQVEGLMTDSQTSEVDYNSQMKDQQKAMNQLRSDYLSQVQQLQQENKIYKQKNEELEKFRQLHLEYEDIQKMQRIAQETITATEKIVSQVMEETEGKKHQLLSAAEEERLNYLMNAKLEVGELRKEQELLQKETAHKIKEAEQKYQALLQLKQDVQQDITHFHTMVDDIRQSIMKEYADNIEAFQKKNDVLRRGLEPQELPQEPEEASGKGKKVTLFKREVQ